MSLINHFTFPRLDGSQHFKRWKSPAAIRRLSPCLQWCPRQRAGAAEAPPRPAEAPPRPTEAPPSSALTGPWDWLGPCQNSSRTWPQEVTDHHQHKAGMEWMVDTCSFSLSQFLSYTHTHNPTEVREDARP